jgi:hypothetical protein
MFKVAKIALFFVFTPFAYWAFFNFTLDLTAEYLAPASSQPDKFNAAKPDTTASSSRDFYPDILPSRDAAREIAVDFTSKAESKIYSANAENPGGNLCKALNLIANRNGGAAEWSGPLENFRFSAVPEDHSDSWFFILNLTSSDTEYENQNCTFDFRFQNDQTSSESDAAVVRNIITSGTWTNQYLPSSGDVIINEIFWSGSARNCRDEWIELRNLTGYAIDLSGWKISNLSEGRQDFQIPPKTTIPPFGYLLLSRYSSSDAESSLTIEPDLLIPALMLADTFNGDLALEDAQGALIDRAAGNGWPAGKKGNEMRSMERKEGGMDGLDPKNWQTADGEFSDSDIFWKVAGNNFGTPKAKNSDNYHASVSSKIISKKLLSSYGRIKKPIKRTDKAIPAITSAMNASKAAEKATTTVILSNIK